MGKNGKLVLLGGCIFISFFLFGLAQEKITKAVYVNADGSVEYYTCSLTLVLIYCGMNYVLSFLLKSFFKEDDTTPNTLFCLGALVYCLAMVTAYLALQFINYPTQVIAKSCKPIPVMIFGVLLGKKSYSFKKYIFVGLVVGGVIMFLYKDVKQKEEKVEVTGFGIGELLVLSSLFMDGMVAAFQERMKTDHQTKPLSMMTNLNKWATLYLTIMWFVTKESYKFILFVQRHPIIIWKLCALSFCGFFGQLSMILTVVEFGTLPASMIATIRKFFSVLTSVLLLGNSLLFRQWIGTLIIFSGLFLDIIYGKSDAKVK